MPDLYLQAMMMNSNGLKKSSTQKDKFDEAIEFEIDQYLLSLEANDSDAKNTPLLSSKQKIQKIKFELLEESKLGKLDEYLSSAMSLIKCDGRRYLDTQQYSDLCADLIKIKNKLDSVDPQQLNAQEFTPLFEILKVTENSLTAILQIAIGKFDEEQDRDSLALFALLVTFDEYNEDYWLRLGIAAQKDENFEFALEAYTMAVYINPSCIRARLFLAEIYLEQAQSQKAKYECAEVKKFCQSEEIDPLLIGFLSNLEELLTLTETEEQVA